MLYSGIHYVSPAGDFAQNSVFWTFKKLKKKWLKWKKLADILKKIGNLNRFWKQDKK